jgi:5-methylcytosine-specific restriction endonuclease McrA
MTTDFKCDNCPRFLKSKGGKTTHMKKCIGVKKTKKKTISAQMKDAVWRKMGNVHEGLCTVCRVNMMSSRSFACGHITAESKDGKTEVGNLMPICTTCNSSMGSKNMDEYKKELWAGREQEYKNDPKDIKEIDHKPTDEVTKNLNELFYPIYRDFNNIIVNNYTAWEMRTMYKLGNVEKLTKDSTAYVDKPICIDFNIVIKACIKNYTPSDDKCVQTHDCIAYLGFIHVLSLMSEQINNYNNVRSDEPSKKYFVEIKDITELPLYTSKSDYQNMLLKCDYSRGGHKYKTFNEWKNAREAYEISQWDSYYNTLNRTKLPEVFRTKKPDDYL